MTRENERSSDIVLDLIYMLSMVSFVAVAIFVPFAIHEQYTLTHGTEYEIGYENGYSDGMIEHLDERYVLCKEYIADTHYSDQTPRMRGYSEGYIKGYEERVSR